MCTNAASRARDGDPRFAPVALAGYTAADTPDPRVSLLRAPRVVMSIKFGAMPIEFEKGKAGIVVPSRDKLPAVIDTLISAVRAGELDELFSQAAKIGSIGKARKAA